MPLDQEATEVSSSTDFTIKAREKKSGETQASETFRVSSTGSRPIGKGGEMGGIAKKDMGDFKDELSKEQDLAMEAAHNRLGEIKEELTRKLEAPDLGEERTRQLKDQLRFVNLKLDEKSREFSSFNTAVSDYADDLIINRAINVQKQFDGQSMTVGTVQPLIRQDLFPQFDIEKQATVESAKLNDLHLLSRAVGSSRVDQMLGTNVLAEEKFGVDANGKPVGISVGVDGVGVIGELGGGKSYFLDTDYSSHDVQKGLYDLEVVDYITGQIDRHPGNIFIDPDTGKVKGIDNDLAFPEMSREEMLSNRHNSQMAATPVKNKPLFMHEDTARNIERMRPEDLRKTLSEIKYPGSDRGKLAPEEIEGAVTRLKEMQDHVKELRKTGHVVSQFDKNTYNEAVTHQEESFERDNKVKLQETRYMSEDMKGSLGRPLNESDNIKVLNEAKKTSYIGALVVERRKNELALRAGGGDMRLDIEGVRRETGSTGKSVRGPEHVEFNKLIGEKKQELKSQITPAHKEEIDGLNTRLAGYEARLERLEKPNLLDRIRSLRYGGVQGAREAFEAKRLETVQKLGDVDKKIESKVNERLEGEKPELWKEAKTRVEQAQLLEQARKQDLDLQLREDQKLGVEGTSVEIGKGKEDELVVDSIELDHSTREVEDLKKDEAPELDSVTVESLRDEAPKVSTEDVGEPKPDLQRQGSVRDLMREKGVVKNVKNMFEPDESDKSVRSQVSVKKGDTETQKGQSVKR